MTTSPTAAPAVSSRRTIGTPASGGLPSARLRDLEVTCDRVAFVKAGRVVRELTLGTAERLVHVDGGVRQGKAAALGPGGEQDRAEGGGDADRHGADGIREHLHGVIDGEARINLPTGRVDIHIDLALRILVIQVEKLGYY